jgi:RNA polymerase sigma-70 factor (ECF subfamily)
VESLEKVIQGCKKSDRHAQNKLYEQLAPTMLVVCLRYSRTREEAEEVLQEGFLQVFKSIGQFKAQGSFEGWVRKIMVNCSLQKLRNKSSLSLVIPIENAGTEPIDIDYTLPNLNAKELIKMIQNLPPMYRAVFNLYVFEGMKHKEIAEVLNISEGTSKSNLSDARQILQKAVIKSQSIAKPTNF